MAKTKYITNLKGNKPVTRSNAGIQCYGGVQTCNSSIQTSLGGDYTGKCYRCGSRDLWDDCTAYGCNRCGMIRFTG